MYYYNKESLKRKMKNLVIVESPGKIKTIGKILGPDYKVLPCVGHIRDLQKRGMSVDTEGDFSPVYEIPADQEEGGPGAESSDQGGRYGMACDR